MRRRVLGWSDPMLALQAAASTSGLEFLRAIMRGSVAPPMAVLMNATLATADRGHVVFNAVPGEEHYNPHGSVHGGFAATLFDTALGGAVHSLLDKGHGYTTLELHVNYVRPITRESGTLICDARVLYGGKRIATAEARLTDAKGELVGHATTTCLIAPR